MLYPAVTEPAVSAGSQLRNTDNTHQSAGRDKTGHADRYKSGHAGGDGGAICWGWGRTGDRRRRSG